MHNKDKVILDKKLPYEYNICLYILEELCDKGVIDAFEMTEAIILLRKKYKIPVINIYGKKDNNSSDFKAATREIISGVIVTYEHHAAKIIAIINIVVLNLRGIKMGLFNTIVVSGKANVGKTTSLKMLAKYFNIRKDVIMEDPENLSKQDYWCSFIINNRRVAIITFGDRADDIKRAFRYLGKCDFYICASHLFGETVKAILELKNECNIVNPLFINKTGVSSNNETIIRNNNEVFTKQLILILDSILEASRDN